MQTTGLDRSFGILLGAFCQESGKRVYHGSFATIPMAMNHCVDFVVNTLWLGLSVTAVCVTAL